MFFYRTLIFYLILSTTVVAGDLDSFEQSAVPPLNNQNDSVDNSSASYSSNSDSCDDESIRADCIGYSIVGNILWAMFYGGFVSTARVNTSVNNAHNKKLKMEFDLQYNNFSDDESVNENSANAPLNPEKNNKPYSLPLRKLHEPQVPFARADVSFQYIKSKTSALDYRLTLGYGPIAFQANQTQFRESTPNDTLKITRIFGVYRMSFRTEVEVGIGLGKLIIEGNNKIEQSYFTIPFKFLPTKSLGFEYRPAWSTTINDYDLSVFSRLKYGSIKAGYRWLSTSSESLNGPYIGFTAFY